MIIRKAVKSDSKEILKLSKKASKTPNGIARVAKEINQKDINQIIENSLKKGLIFVMENPKNPKELIAEIHCYRFDPACFKHTLANLTLVVDPKFHGQGLGKKIFSYLLEEIKSSHQDIYRIELTCRQNNPRAIKLYQSLGFKIEGILEKRILDFDGNLSDDTMMAWINPCYLSQTGVYN